MIIRRKLFTRQEAKAMKEIYEALKKGNLGRNLSAKDFVKARHVSNETVRALNYQDKGEVANFAKNAEVIEGLGLPETSKAYQRMIEKYTNPKLRARLKSIQDARSTSKIRTLRDRKNRLEKELESYDKTTPVGKRNLDIMYGKGNIKEYNADRDYVSDEYRNVLSELEKVKKERGKEGKTFKFNRKELRDSAAKENKDIVSLNKEAQGRATDYETGTKTQGKKKSWKIKSQLQKEGVKANISGNEGSYHNSRSGEIYVNRGNSRDPMVILHENSHRISSTRGEVVGKGPYYKGWGELSQEKNTSHNLPQSIINRISDLTTLTEEANASYHATARAKKYGVTKKQFRRGKKNLDDAFKTYETGAAQNINYDNYIRNLGKNKYK